MINVSICIVNYNTADLTIKCIDSIFQNTKDIKFEIIVVDNASIDGSIDLFKKKFSDKILLIQNRTNRYFTGGFNDAIYSAKGEYVLILNSDTYFVDNSIKLMVDFLDKYSNVGAVEGCIYNDDTKMPTKTSSMELTLALDSIRSNKIKKIIFKNKYDKYAMLDWDRCSDKKVEVLCDAFMLVRAELFKNIGGYNEALKLYFTEEYLSDMIRIFGYELWHLGSPKVYHAWSSSTKKVSQKFIDIIYKTDRDIYFELKNMMKK
ncbi:glycosyltransferase [Campylobacter curvus]|uniref:glycosyltransferase n=1 Tax=Campylobacter curvus TaxID=200 RepID=UPI00147058AB|nr:glycosyltransferase [Campylobacter curvus]